MVVILRENPNEKQLENLKNWLTSLGLEIHISRPSAHDGSGVAPTSDGARIVTITPCGGDWDSRLTALPR